MTADRAIARALIGSDEELRRQAELNESFTAFIRDNCALLAATPTWWMTRSRKP